MRHKRKPELNEGKNNGQVAGGHAACSEVRECDEPGNSKDLMRGCAIKRALFILSSLAVVGVVFATPASAQMVAADRATYLTFSAPVSLPGVSLPAGTYLFRFVDPMESDSVLEVLSQDGKTVYAIVNTIPATRSEAKAEATVTFKETRSDAPPQIQKWFFADSADGCELLQ